jgi:hypothetical protein
MIAIHEGQQCNSTPKDTMNTMVSSTCVDNNTASTTQSDHSVSSYTIGLRDDLEESHHGGIDHNQKQKYPKMVTFSTIEVREYPIIPGDNPASLSGVPLTIDWTPFETASCHVDEYEANKPPSRQMVELRMPPSYRKELLRRLGFSRSELLASLQTTTIVRNQRRRTVETMQYYKAQEALEKVKRAALNATLRRSKKSQEKKFLQNFAKQMHTFHKDELFQDCSRHNSITTVSSACESLEVVVVVSNSKELSPPLFQHKSPSGVR